MSCVLLLPSTPLFFLLIILFLNSSFLSSTTFISFSSSSYYSFLLFLLHSYLSREAGWNITSWELGNGDTIPTFTPCHLFVPLQFIQPRGKPPTETFQLTVPHWAIKYLYSVRYYLRQNLLQNQFLHPPKYIDGKPDNHFQDCVSWKGRGPMGVGPDPCEADVFLYNRPHKAEGGTGKGLSSFEIIPELFITNTCTHKDAILPKITVKTVQ